MLTPWVLSPRCAGLPCLCVESCWTPTCLGSPGILCSWGIATSVCRWSGENRGHAYFPFFSQVPLSHWTSHTKHKFKAKMILCSRWQHQNIKTSMCDFWASDPVWLHTSHTSTCEVGMCRCVCVHTGTYYIFLARRCRPFIRFLKECPISQKDKTIPC